MWHQEGGNKSNAKQFNEHGKLVEPYNVGRSTRDEQVTVSSNSTYKPSLGAPWNDGRELHREVTMLCPRVGIALSLSLSAAEGGDSGTREEGAGAGCTWAWARACTCKWA